MSWLFGLKRDPVPDLASIGMNQDPADPPSGEGQAATGGGSGSGSGSNDDRKNMRYGFDSTALERAAAAARELEKSGTKLLQ